MTRTSLGGLHAHALLCAFERGRVANLLLDLGDGHGADLREFAVENLSKVTDGGLKFHFSYENQRARGNSFA